MTDLEAIEIRQSRRSYLDTPIAPESIRTLEKMIDRYNAVSGLNMQFIKDGRKAFRGLTLGYGMFQGVQSYIALIGKASDENLEEKVGYYGELLILEATKLGLGTCFVCASYNKSHGPTIKEDEVLHGVITVGYVSEKKGFKENAIYKIAHRSTKALEELYIADEAVPDWFINGVKAVQKAPSAMNRQPVLLRFQSGIVTAEVKRRDLYQLIDLGIAKAHFEIGAACGRFELGNQAPFILSRT